MLSRDVTLYNGVGIVPKGITVPRDDILKKYRSNKF